MDTLLQDLRYSLRLLIKTPGVTVVAALALALGVGVNAATFSLLNTMILKPLPYHDADRLMFLGESRPQIPFLSVSYPNYLDWRDENRSFEEMGIVRGQQYNLTGNQEPARLMGAHASANLFTTLGVAPVLGRTFEPEDDRPGATPVAVLGYGLWQRHFGGDASILGQTLTLNDLAYTVIGVMPQDFRWFLQHEPPEIWTPIGLWADAEMLSDRGNRSGMSVIARLREGVTIEQAEADLGMIAARLEERYPETNAGSGILTTPFHERVVGDARTPLMILLAAVGLVLLIACANVANLLLARAEGRRKEIAVRVAMGAGRGRIVRQLLTESVVLALTGGILGLFLAYLNVDLIGVAIPSSMPRIDEVAIDGTILGLTALLALATGVVFGLVPALQNSRPDLNDTLKESVRGSTGERNRVRAVLVVAEVALALVLLVGAGLLIKSFWRLQTESPGFNPDRVLTAQLVLTGTSYPDEDARLDFYHSLLERVRSLPGVKTAATVNPLPVTHTGWQTRFIIEGLLHPQPGELPMTEWMQVSPGYLQTMEIPLLRGRTFTELDRRGAPSVVIIDETFASRHFANEDPIGRRIAFGDLATSDEPTWREIVGVVGHVKLNGVAEEAGIEMYVPYEQAACAPMSLVIQTASEPGGVVAAVRSAMLAIDPNLPLYNVRMMDELLANTVLTRRAAMVLLTVFAWLALVLAAVGIYGVLSYTVSRRTHEIGIRMALGAQQKKVVRLVVGQGMTLALTGLAIGTAGAFAVTRLMGSMLFAVEPADPTVFGAALLILGVVALAASAIPARRASRVHPLVALRYE